MESEKVVEGVATPNKSNAKSNSSSPVSPKETNSQKQLYIILIIILLLLVAGLAVTGLFAWRRISEIDDSSDRIETVDDSTKEATDGSADDQGEDGDEASDPDASSDEEVTECPVCRDVWYGYKETVEYDLSFKYPERFQVRMEYPSKELLVTHTVPDATEPDAESKNEVIISISHEFQPATYGSIDDPEEVNPAEMPPITVDGTEYIFKKYILGEGSFGHSYYQSTYIFTVRDDLHISIYSYKSSSQPYCEDGICSTGESSFTTPAEALQLAREVVQSIELD